MTSFEVWKDQGVGLIEADGVLDARDVPALRLAFDEAAQLAEHHRIAVIDAAVAVFDPAALGALLAQHGRLQQCGGTLAVIGTDGPIARLLRVAGVGSGVRVYASLDDALAALSGDAHR